MPCNKKYSINITMLSLTLSGVLFGVNAYAEDGFVAGVQPDRRPEGAPVFQPSKKDKEWYDQVLTGLDRPYPGSFRFLEDQGNWYTPFNHPGMVGYYDIRGWHNQSGD